MSEQYVEASSPNTAHFFHGFLEVFELFLDFESDFFDAWPLPDFFAVKVEGFLRFRVASPLVSASEPKKQNNKTQMDAR